MIALALAPLGSIGCNTLVDLGNVSVRVAANPGQITRQTTNKPLPTRNGLHLHMGSMANQDSSVAFAGLSMAFLRIGILRGYYYYYIRRAF